MNKTQNLIYTTTNCKTNVRATPGLEPTTTTTTARTKARTTARTTATAVQLQFQGLSFQLAAPRAEAYP